jgi:hypothetical protein
MKRYGSSSLLLQGSSLTGGCREEGGNDERRRGSRDHRRGSRKVEDHILVHLVQAAAREVAGNAGKKRRPRAREVAGELGRGNERDGEDVWESRVSGAVLRVCSTGLFIAQRGRGAGWPDRGHGMDVTRSRSCSSGRDGRGSVGVVCRCYAAVGGALASLGD